MLLISRVGGGWGSRLEHAFGDDGGVAELGRRSARQRDLNAAVADDTGRGSRLLGA